MSEEKMFAAYEKLLSVECEKIDMVMAEELNGVAAEAARDGMYHSSRTALLGVKKVSDTLTVRANVAMLLAERCAVAAGFEFHEKNAKKISNRITEWFDAEVLRLVNLLKGSKVFPKSIVNESNEDAYLKNLYEIARLTKTEIEAKFDLLAMQNQTRSKNNEIQAGPNITIAGNVGSVLTGNYSSSNVVQNIDAGTSQAIVDALDKLTQEIAKTGESNTDLQEVVDEAKSELQKEKPNKTKLVGLLRGISETISLIPKFKTAYETLKWAAVGLGIHL